ncbi:hypothetical protein [uncultured Winogradskyella sp.]|uniref:hypothetical protein n=1 Tax=uncultured Winogradskyella sp. TaxID=395353 RepID=UPI0030DC6D27|tara:strand:- start:62970 stop:63392 length:423 start_codon:yes stop_codon:yes gene_type:complete
MPILDKPAPKNKRKGLKDYFDFRNSQANQVGLILFSSFVIGTSLIYVFEQRFNEERWKENRMQRYKMVDDIIDRNLFVNDSKNDVIDQLGAPKILNSSTTNQFNYYIGEGLRFSNSKPAMLTLIFENNKVTQVKILPSIR